MFTTLDMIDVNLVTGECTFLKYGSCPTYIIRNHSIMEIQTQSLPIGIISPLEISIEKTKLIENDIIVMISDGFHQPFKEFLEDNEYLIGDDHPKDIAQLFMQLSHNSEHNDDMTIIVLKLCKQ
jgi:serine phosphatase RsbU (regulator of sigma subunit)